MTMIPTILGLDASTTTIGHGIIKIPNHKPILDGYGYFKPPKDGNIFLRLQEVESHISQLIDQYKPTHIALEDIIMFMKNKSNAHATISLAILNRTVGMTVLHKFNNPPELLNVLTIRHSIKKIATLALTNRQIPQKEDLPEIISQILGIPFPYQYKVYKSKKKAKNIIAPETYDVSDAICVALTVAKKQNLI